MHLQGAAVSHTQRKVLHRQLANLVVLPFKYSSVGFLLIVLLKSTFDFFFFLLLLLTSFRYDIRIYPTFLHLHGKTFDYKIPYTTVLRLFLLPHKDQRQMFFVVNGLLHSMFAQITVFSFLMV